jgi:hypothetical protein
MVIGECLTSAIDRIERKLVLNTTKLIAAGIVLSLIMAPTISFARAKGGSGGGFSSGSRSSGGSGSIGSRGSRTYAQNGAKPIEQSTTPRQSATAQQPAAGSSAPSAQPTPASQPSFLQRNPLLAGIAGGIAGSWIGHMLFGATDSSARTNEAGDHVGETGTTAGSSNSTTILLLLMLLIGATLYYFVKVRRSPTPDFSGITRSSAVTGALLAESSTTTPRPATLDNEVTSADKAAFQQLLIDVQTSWSKQDLAGLRRCVTPEMLTYFSTALAEHTSQEIENHVEDVVLLRAEARESWTEDATQYATVGLRWKARDYTVSLTKKPGEAGYLIEGSEETPIESGEVWTFMRYQNGKWLLSAIQQ